MDSAGNDGTTGIDAAPAAPAPAAAHAGNGAAADTSGLNGATPHAAAADAGATLNAAAADAAAAGAEPAAKSAGKFMSMLKNNKGIAITAAIVAIGAVVAMKHFRGKEEASRA